MGLLQRRQTAVAASKSNSPSEHCNKLANYFAVHARLHVLNYALVH